jgi:hypothetical protein
VARDDLRDDAYDPNQIYVGGSKDSQGHSTNIRAKIPDTWMGSIGEIVNSPDWPEYRSVQDFYRDAIYHRMRWATRQPDRLSSPKVKHLIALAQSKAALDYANLVRQSNQELVTDAERTLRDLAADGNQLALKQAIKELETGLDQMEEPWRSELARLLETYERRSYGL